MKFRKLAHVALAALLVVSCNPVDRAMSADSKSNDKARGGYTGSSFTTYEALETKILLPPAAVPAAGTVNGTGIDREDARSALVTCTFSALAGGTSITINIDESDVVGSGYTAVSGAAFTAFTPARVTVPGVFYGNLDLRGRKQFLRATEVTVGTFTTSFRSCNITLAGQVNLPVTWTQATADFNKL